VKDVGVESPIEKFVDKGTLQQIADRMSAKTGDLLLVVSDKPEKAYPILGSLRLEMAERLGLIQAAKEDYRLLWVTEFPLLEWNKEESRYVSMHHPFTSPKPEDVSLLDTDPGKVRARAYDLVLNGNEIAGGSIRIHSFELQSKMFRILGISDDEARTKFGFLLDAFKYGAPPHGGVAFGYDRIVMLFCGQKSLREIIAFPKTSSAQSLMDDSPSEVSQTQLDELHMRIKG
jgi:aspartyl-tRNA synthetase